MRRTLRPTTITRKSSEQGSRVGALGRRRNGGWVYVCPSPGAGIRLLGRRRNGGWVYVCPSPGAGVRLLGRRRNGGWVYVCPSPGAGVRLLGRRRNGGWVYVCPSPGGIWCAVVHTWIKQQKARNCVSFGLFAVYQAFMVPRAGVEPARPRSPHFECGASTNSANGASQSAVAGACSIRSHPLPTKNRLSHDNIVISGKKTVRNGPPNCQPAM